MSASAAKAEQEWTTAVLNGPCMHDEGFGCLLCESMHERDLVSTPG